MTTWALDAVEDDLDAITRYLEQQRSGTSFRFLDAYNQAFDTIRRFPQFYPLVEDDHPPHEVRNAVLHPFDYRVVYLVRPAEAVILAVTHTSRRPGH